MTLFEVQLSLPNFPSRDICLTQSDTGRQFHHYTIKAWYSQVFCFRYRTKDLSTQITEHSYFTNKLDHVDSHVATWDCLFLILPVLSIFKNPPRCRDLTSGSRHTPKARGGNYRTTESTMSPRPEIKRWLQQEAESQADALQCS